MCSEGSVWRITKGRYEGAEVCVRSKMVSQDQLPETGWMYYSR